MSYCSLPSCGNREEEGRDPERKLLMHGVIVTFPFPVTKYPTDTIGEKDLFWPTVWVNIAHHDWESIIEVMVIRASSHIYS